MKISLATATGLLLAIRATRKANRKVLQARAGSIKRILLSSFTMPSL